MSFSPRKRRSACISSETAVFLSCTNSSNSRSACSPQCHESSKAVICAIVVMPITNDAGRNIGGEHALEFMADGTGGRCFQPTVGAELDKAFTSIITELRTQYLLAYYPQNVPLNKDRFHKLAVRVTHPDLRAFARNGYYGEVEGGRGGSPEDRVTVSPDRQLMPTKKR